MDGQTTTMTTARPLLKYGRLKTNGETIKRSCSRLLYPIAAADCRQTHAAETCCLNLRVAI